MVRIIIGITVIMQNIYNKTGLNSVHISNIINCYHVNIDGMWNARKVDEITFELTLT